jgi:Aspartyl protease
MLWEEDSMMIRSLLLGVALQAAAAFAAEPSAPSLSVRADRLFMPIEVNGQKTEALLDSAAESSLIDPTFASELGLRVAGEQTARGSGGTTEARFAKVSVRAAGVNLNGITVAVVDLSDISHRLVGSKIRFILGRELFDAARLRIDIGAGTLKVLSAHDPVSGAALPLSEHAGIESFPVRADGVAAAADFDLGNGGQVLVGKAFAERNGWLAPGRIIARRKGGGLGGEIERDVIKIGRLELGGKTLHDIEAEVDPMDNAGDLNLGVRILRQFMIVTDFAQHRIWLLPP